MITTTTDNLQQASATIGKTLRRITEPRADRLKAELKRADVDGRERGDQSAQVEPGGRPTPAAVAEDRGPVIQAAGRRKGRGDLSHRRGKGQGEQTGHRPAEADRRSADAAKPLMKRRDAAREDADDRQRNGVVGKPAHPPHKFLAVAHPVQRFDIRSNDLGLVGGGFGHGGLMVSRIGSAVRASLQHTARVCKLSTVCQLSQSGPIRERSPPVLH